MWKQMKQWWDHLGHGAVRGEAALAGEGGLPAALRVPLAQTGVEAGYLLLLGGLCGQGSLLGNVIQVGEVEGAAGQGLVTAGTVCQQAFHRYLPAAKVKWGYNKTQKKQITTQFQRNPI